MIDLHNHLLPGIDDGAPDMETALALARVAVEDGIHTLVCTPHIHPGRYDNTQVIIESTLYDFRQALAQACIPLKVDAAAEVRISPEIMLWIKAGELPFVGQWQGKPVLLLELPHSGVPLGSDKLTLWLLKQGVVPMIAHPERNKGILQCISRLKPFIDQGCLLQVTAGSIAGKFGEKVEALAIKLLQEERIHILASDAHNLEHRPPKLSVARETTEALTSAAYFQRLVEENPRKMISG
ncbi:tyrosine-protein phosphatase [Nitrincola tapanii]|uniref:protein-tyrosine-phosphatase n=1 Tax=Nitrincola tapanii TaxID=1708751 RepID=A0A5A9W4Q5_9GAMM|nr:CpsB/CapC family capsule biosynthesis tyrosine phosphatase [Nitrincola tapanii]KAA0875756.1 capsular biosynthesis protein [Nitrincola tapanii]